MPVPGVNTNDRGAGCRMVSGAAATKTPADAVINTAESGAVWSAFTVNVCEMLPDGTVTVAGTVARKESEDDNRTTCPPAGAGPHRVTVAVDALPEITSDGDSFKVFGAGTRNVRDVRTH